MKAGMLLRSFQLTAGLSMNLLKCIPVRPWPLGGCEEWVRGQKKVGVSDGQAPVGGWQGACGGWKMSGLVGGRVASWEVTGLPQGLWVGPGACAGGVTV